MGLETGTYINDLNPNNPVNATDGVGEGDDHLRLIKSTLLNTFPNVTGKVSASHAEINRLVGATENIQDALDTLDSGKADATTTANALALKANDADVVKLAGAQEITGSKNFSAAQQFATIELGHASDTTLARVAAGRVSVEGAELARLSAAQAFTQPQQFTTIELGHASDTTLSRIAAGRVAIEGNEISKLASINTFTGNGTRLSAPIILSSTNPDLAWFQTGAGADEKGWDIIALSGTLRLRTMTDAGTGGFEAFRVNRSGTEITSFELHTAGGAQFLTQSRSAAPATTGAQVRHADSNLYDVGMNVMPLQSITSSFTIERTHVGKVLAKGESTARTLTLPASTDTDIPLGATVNIVNNGTGAITIAPGSGITLNRYDGAGAPDTGTHTLARGGVATLYRASAATWYLWGNAGLS